jgi:diguanylate cyclase (GGDEF)-like protein
MNGNDNNKLHLKGSQFSLFAKQNITEPDSTIIMQKQKRTDVKKVHAALIIIEGVEISKHFILRRSIYTIGRTNDADISIKSDPMISRRHAQIELIFDQQTKTAKYLLTDLNSSNHTYVNGQQISKKYLIEGDKIHIGETTLKFVLQDDIDARFHKEIQDRIRYDLLTSLLTKEAFYSALKSELTRCNINELQLSLLMMDIDFFKKVNDTYGHPAGSSVLSEVARLIKDNLRDLDLSARYGGEEFIAFLSETTKTQALTIAERIRQFIKNHVFVYNDKIIKITISIGVSQYPEDGGSVKELVAKADEALYRCKHTGRNKVCLSSQ